MMEWGLTLNVRDSLQGVVQKSRIADSGGLDYIWIADFPSTKYAPAVASIVAHSVKTCRIGLGLMSVFLYDVDSIVQALSTLIDSYGERFDLLLGPGDKGGLKRAGVSFGEPSTVVDRVISIAERIKSRLVDAGHACPIWLGAQGPKMIKASTSLDGVLLNYADSDMIAWALRLLSDRPDDFRVGIFPPTLITDKMKQTDVNGFHYSAAVVFLGLVRSVAKKFDLNEPLKHARAKVKESGFNHELVESIDPLILDMFGIRRTISEMADYIESVERMNVDLVVSGPPQGLRVGIVEDFVLATRYR